MSFDFETSRADCFWMSKLLVFNGTIFRARIREVFVYEEKPKETYTVEIQPCRYLLNKTKERITWAEDIALQVDSNPFV